MTGWLTPTPALRASSECASAEPPRPPPLTTAASGTSSRASDLARSVSLTVRNDADAGPRAPAAAAAARSRSSSAAAATASAAAAAVAAWSTTARSSWMASNRHMSASCASCWPMPVNSVLRSASSAFTKPGATATAVSPHSVDTRSPNASAMRPPMPSVRGAEMSALNDSSVQYARSASTWLRHCSTLFR